MNKEDNFKEKFKQALISTVKVISEDYRPSKDGNNASSKNINFFELDNLSSKHDFTRFRAESDSVALKKKFSDKKNEHKNVNIYQIEASQEKLINYYDEHNIFVLPSYTEGYPMVLLESLARLRPVIIFEEINYYQIYVYRTKSS